MNNPIYMLWILGDTTGEAAIAAGEKMNILLQLARVGVAGLAIYILKLAYHLYKEANSGDSVAVIKEKQNGATKYLTLSFVLVGICTLIEIIRLFAPNHPGGPVKAWVGLTGWTPSQVGRYGLPTITLKHEAGEKNVRMDKLPDTVEVKLWSNINVNVEELTKRIDQANLEKVNALRAIVVPQSPTLKPTAIE